MLHEQFRPEDYGRRRRDELATMRQSGRESVADFVFRFRATCLKIPDLSEVEKMDHFVRALAQDVRLQWSYEVPEIFTKRQCLPNGPTRFLRVSPAKMRVNHGKRVTRGDLSGAHHCRIKG